MKKILTLLAGIAFVIAILIASGCKMASSSPQKAEQEKDPKKVTVVLKDTIINCMMHLVMYNDDDRKNSVIDNLYTDVQPGYTVKWKADNSSDIRHIHHVRIMDAGPWDLPDSCLVATEDPDDRGNLKFEVPLNADTGTVKYEIIFEDNDGGFWCIDPYLRIED